MKKTNFVKNNYKTGSPYLRFLAIFLVVVCCSCYFSINTVLGATDTIEKAEAVTEVVTVETVANTSKEVTPASVEVVREKPATAKTVAKAKAKAPKKSSAVKPKAAVKIDLSDYTPADDMHLLTKTQRQVAEAILEEFFKHKDDALDTVSFEIGEFLSRQDYLIVDTYFMMYFGTKEYADNHFNVLNGNTIVVNLDVFRAAYKGREAILSRVEKILSTFYEGSFEYKLQQISDYIDEHATYVVDRRTAADVLFDKKGNCIALSFVFKFMANRLGITCDICTGVVQGNHHAWNRALIGSKYYYYDMNGYGFGKLKQYIHAKSYNCSDFAINNFY